MDIIKTRNLWLGISLAGVVLSIIAICLWQLNYSVDFTGGALMEVSFLDKSPAVSEIKDEILKVEGVKEVNAQSLGENNYIFRLPDISNEVRQNILNSLEAKYYPKETYGDFSVKPIEEIRFESVGSIIGNELKSKAIKAVILAIIGIALYIAWAFRKVSRVVSSWKYGICAVIALFHDITLVVGIFAVLGHFYGVEVGITFIAALLTILGYSVNDTIIVFDKIRENLLRFSKGTFEETVNKSILESITRSVNTSLTTLFALLALLVFGGESIRFFALALTLGIIFGTYSSIFVASSLLVVWHNWEKK